MWFAGALPQNRWTVVFRLILGIPQYMVLYFLYIATLFIVIIGWFGALIMGRLPGWAHQWISGVIRWSARVGAYSLLLTDRYPPFSFEDQLYPVRPMLPPAGGRLNRWSVLFRIILGIPGFVFASIVRYGLLFPLIIVMWVVVIVRGSMPPQLYTAYAAYLRYETRLQSWVNMLTSEYSWGMLGDRDAAASARTTPPPPGAAPAPPPPGSMPPPVQPPSWSAPPPPAPAPPPTAPPVTPGGPPPAPPAYGGAAMPPPSAWERSGVPVGEALPPWGTLVLEGAARGWMIFAIVWGSVIFVGQNVTQNVVFGNHHHHNTSYLQPPGPSSSPD